MPETWALWARSGFVPAPPRNDPFSSFPTLRSRRDFSNPDGRLLRLELSTANNIDPIPPSGAITVMDAPPARPMPGLAEPPFHASGRARARAARREPRMRAGASWPLRASGGSSATGRRDADPGHLTEPRAVLRAASVQETAARLFPARGSAVLSQLKAPSFRESVANAADSALNNPKGARIEKVHRTAAPEIPRPGAGVP